MVEEPQSWQVLLKQALTLFVADCVDREIVPHVANTPQRIVKAYAEYISGYLEDETEPLKKSLFDSTFDEMIHCRKIRIVSRCAHHMEPILGVAHFAYVPKSKIVGLSKIPRFIDILSRRLQVQEQLTDQIVNTFQEVVQPGGCAVTISAYHFCMLARGVREHSDITQTTALRGCFRDHPQTRAEYMAAVNPNENIFA
jgi:GTP cyclohydrolase I